MWSAKHVNEFLFEWHASQEGINTYSLYKTPYVRPFSPLSFYTKLAFESLPKYKTYGLLSVPSFIIKTCISVVLSSIQKSIFNLFIWNLYIYECSGKLRRESLIFTIKSNVERLIYNSFRFRIISNIRGKFKK